VAAAIKRKKLNQRINKMNEKEYLEAIGKAFLQGLEAGKSKNKTQPTTPAQKPTPTQENRGSKNVHNKTVEYVNTTVLPVMEKHFRVPSGVTQGKYYETRWIRNYLKSKGHDFDSVLIGKAASAMGAKWGKKRLPGEEHKVSAWHLVRKNNTGDDNDNQSENV